MLRTNFGKLRMEDIQYNLKNAKPKPVLHTIPILRFLADIDVERGEKAVTTHQPSMNTAGTKDFAALYLAQTDAKSTQE